MQLKSNKSGLYSLLIFLFFLTGSLIFATTPLLAQIQTFPGAANSQQQQRLADESLANEFIKNREFDKAYELYVKLYDQYPNQYYFTGLINTLIQLNRLKDAEQAIRKQMRGQNDIQLSVDLGYIYLLEGDKSKSDKTFNKIIEELPADRNRINQASNAFRVRNLDEFALKVYEKGSKMPQLNYPFYLEKAGLYQTSGDFSKAIDEYLLQLDYQPEQYELIKNRLMSSLMMGSDEQMAELLRNKLLEKVQSNPENENLNKLLIWFFLQQKDYDFAMNQAKALDRRFGDRDALVLEIADISLENNQFATALDGYKAISSKGNKGAYYFYALFGELKSRYHLAESEHSNDISYYQKLSTDIDKAIENIGWNTESSSLAIIQAQIFAYKLNRSDDAVTLLQKQLNLQHNAAAKNELKMYLADIMLFKNEVWEATLLYSQIDKEMKNEPVGHEARFRNARLRYFIGEYGWAVGMLDVLKAATSKLTANDALSLSLQIHDFLKEDTTGMSLKAFGAVDLLIYQKNDKDAKKILDTLMINASYAALQPYFLMRKAELTEKDGEFQLADSLYTQIYTRFQSHFIADDALMRDALLNETKLIQPEKAMKLYELLMDSFSSSIFVIEARRKFRILRGDSGQS